MTRWNTFILAGLLAFAWLAATVMPLHSQCTSTGMLPIACPKNYGDGDVGRAMSICSDRIARSILNSTIPPPRIPSFQQGWEACAKVWAVWLESEEARKQREYEAEVEQQRQFVNDLAEKLK